MREQLDNFWWLEYGLHCIITGSNIICDPPVMNTDRDYMMLCDPETVPSLEKALLAYGYRSGGSGVIGGQEFPLEEFPTPESISRKESNVFHSWKKDPMNLLVTACSEYFYNFGKATVLGMKLNLLKKHDRISLFEAVTQDRWPDYNILLK